MRWCYPRHEFAFRFVKMLLWPYLRLRYGFRAEKFKLKKDRPCLILSNHRGFWDPFLVCYVYDRPIHFMATDNIFTNGFASRMLEYWLAPIPKKKQEADFRAVKSALRIASENGVVGVFPEGSRSYDGAPTSVDIGIAQLAKKMGGDLAVCGLFGVYASDPRWGFGKRRGRSLLKTVYFATAEEMAQMTDEQLLEKITGSMDINETETEDVVYAENLAEKLESFIYVCPVCGATCRIYSKGNEFGCEACGMHGVMNPNLTLSFDDPSVKIRNLVQWHRIQRRYGRQFEAVPGQVIFTDEKVRFMESDNATGAKKDLGTGELSLTDTAMIFRPRDGAEVELPIKDIRIVSPVGMKKLLVSGRDFSYYLEGEPGFNGYKYTQIYYTLTGQPDREVK